jgi:hypothetical protein
MDGENAPTTISAARIVASVFGVLAGLGGMTHGIGETVQGSVAPGGIVIASRTGAPSRPTWGASQQ